MKYNFKNFLDFRRHFTDVAYQNGIDLGLYFDVGDFFDIYISCILKGVNPVDLTFDQINSIIYNMLEESEE